MTGFVDDIGDCSPNGESVIGSNLYLRKVWIGRYEPSEAVSLDETLQCVITVKLANSYLTFGWIAVALINYDNVTRMYTCIDH